MKRRTIALVLILSLLSIAAVGFNGCGKKNTITSITVTPVDPFIAKLTARQLFVTAHFSDGKDLLFWTQVTWQSDKPTVATVSSTGLVTAVSEGTAVITAVDIAHPSITGSVTATVTDLLSITIDPASAIISLGTSTPFTATGTYSAATPSTAPTNLTSLVTWTTSNTEIAIISNVTGSNGIATAGTTTGTTTITATDPATNIFSTATLTVVP
jgi:trimeric autotransporter adhesin